MFCEYNLRKFFLILLLSLEDENNKSKGKTKELQQSLASAANWSGERYAGARGKGKR